MQNASQVLTKSVLLDRISQETPDCTELTENAYQQFAQEAARRERQRVY
jgi:hypothetical protein